MVELAIEMTSANPHQASYQCVYRSVIGVSITSVRPDGPATAYLEIPAEMGLPQGETKLFVDNSGAVELSRDRKSCHCSRHVDRRYFKVRELAYERAPVR
jgi:hypothetical protein